MKRLLLLILFLYSAFNSFSQAFQWAKTQGDAESRQAKIRIASDGTNLISSGTYILPITFGSQTFANKGGAGYLVKQNSDGSLLWAKHLQGVNSIGKVETDLNQNIIVSGSYVNFLYIDKSVFTDYSGTGASQFRNFIAKFDSNGALLWAQKLPELSEQSAVTTDGLGNIYYADFYVNSVTIGTTTLTVPTGNFQDVLIVKYNPAGVMQWVKPGSQNEVYNFSIIGSPTGGVYLGCYAQGPSTEIFLRKYNGSGTQVWNRSVLNNDISSAFALSLDQAENLYLIGSNEIGNSAALNFGNISVNLNGTFNGFDRINEFFLAKINTLGDWKWAKKIASGNYASFYVEAAPKIKNALFFTGSFKGNIQFGNSSLTSQARNESYFNIKLDTAGNPLRAFKMEATSMLFIDELATDMQENLFLAGSFRGETLIGYNKLTNYKPMTPIGFSTLGFLAKTLNAPNTLSGSLFIDANGNGLKDAGEKPFKNGIVENMPNLEYAITDSTGQYQFYLPSGNFYLQVAHPANHYTFSPQNYSVSFTGVGQTQTKDFALVPIPNRNDVKVTVTNLTPARPGFDFKYRITYQNVGTTTLSDSISFKYTASNLTYISSSLAPAIQQPGKLSWFYQPLQPNDIRNIDVTFTVAASTPINTAFQALATIKPILTDFIPANNYDTLNHVVTGSYDPNDKQVNKNVITPKGDYLTYTIRFQNTGTDTAFTVRITDDLSEKFQPGTVEVLSASHPYKFKFTSNRTINWTFENILLPDSNRNKAASHGFVKFRIKTQPDLISGDSVMNDAAIYFDYNEPVLTNLAVTKIETPKVIPDNSELGILKLFPNPTTEKVNILTNLPEAETATISLINSLGQKIRTLELPAHKRSAAELPLTNLSRGVYIIQMETGSGIQIKRLVIQ